MYFKKIKKIKKNSIAVKVIKLIKGKKNPNDQIEAN